MSRIRTSLLALAAAALVAASGTIAAANPAAAHDAHDITVRDAWVKVAKRGEMTAVFGTIVNTGKQPIPVTAARTPASRMTEIHEVVVKDGAMAMQPKQGGITVPAGSRTVLKPGGDHLMLMKLTRAVKPGQRIAVTLTLGDGSTVTFRALAKPFAGANESYEASR